MRNKTYKLQKLEKQRKSILTDDLEHCIICKMPAQDIHEIYGGKNRKVSMINNFCVPLCRNCHIRITNSEKDSIILKKLCQKKFEENNSREKFLSIIYRNYL